MEIFNLRKCGTGAFAALIPPHRNERALAATRNKLISTLQLWPAAIAERRLVYLHAAAGASRKDDAVKRGNVHHGEQQVCYLAAA